jgi:hypothetical protein
MTPETIPAPIDASRLKHLEMLQQVIARMANNSFLVKGWSITLISALLAFATKDKMAAMAWIAFLPLISFWLLDGFFLYQERLFRALYINNSKPPLNFPSDLSFDTSKIEGVSWVDAIFSTSLIIFHGLLAVMILAVIVFNS